MTCTKESKSMDDTAKLIARIHTRLCLTEAALPEEYSFASLPLCIIDSVFSIQTKYDAVVKPLVWRWCDFQQPKWDVYRGPRCQERSIAEFLAVLNRESNQREDFESLASQVFKNRQRTSSKSGILKAEAVHRFATALHHCGINTFEDMKEANKINIAEESVKTIPGQRSGITFTYFRMLAGSDDLIKPDSMVRRFVAEALGTTHEAVTTADAGRLVTAAAAELRKMHPKLTVRLLDYAIWKYESESAARKTQRRRSGRECATLCPQSRRDNHG
jgi:hypothetical protein